LADAKCALLLLFLPGARRPRDCDGHDDERASGEGRGREGRGGRRARRDAEKKAEKGMSK